MRRDLVTYEALVAYGKRTYPGFDVRVKNDSPLMKLLAGILFFNPSFMPKFATTVGSVVYFPREWLNAAAAGDRPYPYAVLAHELVHIADYKESRVLFSVSYLLPQILGVFALLAPLLSWWWLLALVFLAPWPAPWRMKIEKRGYAMSLALIYWERGYLSESPKTWIAPNFTGASYYFMWPFKRSVAAWLTEVERQLSDGSLLDQGLVYKDVHDIVKSSGVQNA